MFFDSRKFAKFNTREMTLFIRLAKLNAREIIFSPSTKCEENNNWNNNEIKLFVPFKCEFYGRFEIDTQMVHSEMTSKLHFRFIVVGYFADDMLISYV